MFMACQDSSTNLPDFLNMSGVDRDANNTLYRLWIEGINIPRIDA